MPEALSTLERRVLGVLVEKALTAATPEPLTLNAVVVGSNQKSNRDPLMSVEEPEVDSARGRLKEKGLVFRIVGGRAERWRHNLYDAWQLSKPEVAFVTELLLRGPQTLAEARARASRMESIDTDQANDLVKSLVERGFVVWLTPAERRGAILTHNLYPPDELKRLADHPSTHAVPELAPAPVERQAPVAGVTLEAFERLQAEVAEIRSALISLHEALGVVPKLTR